jgi:hypothetical protein
MWTPANSARFTIQTPGWYKVSYGVNVGTVGGVFMTAVRSTTGSNNPQGAGVNSNYYWAGAANVVASSIAYPGSTGDWPFYLYAGDYLSVFVKAATAGASTSGTGITGGNNGGSFFTAELVSI